MALLTVLPYTERCFYYHAHPMYNMNEGNIDCRAAILDCITFYYKLPKKLTAD